MIRRVTTMFAGGLAAALASQAPEFAQQYGQRLGGAVDELRTVVERFDQDARRNGLSREGGLNRLETSTDPFLTARGASLRSTMQRFDQLESQRQTMRAPDVLTRVGAVVRNYDGDIARAAWRDYKPALPLTLEGLLFALIGFAGGTLVTAIAVLPMGRRQWAGKVKAGKATPRTAFRSPV
jgi:Protein of unknown function (DUF2937)